MRFLDVLKTKPGKEFNIDHLLEDLKALDDTERIIWEYHKKNKYVELFESIEQRTHVINQLGVIYNDLDNEKFALEREIKTKHPEVKSVEFHEKNYPQILDEIESLVAYGQQQLREFQKAEVILNRGNSRELVLSGVAKDNMSEMTRRIRDIIRKCEEHVEFIKKNKIKLLEKTSTQGLQEIYLESFQRDFSKLSTIDRSKLLSLKEFYELRINGDAKYINTWFTICETIAYGEEGFKIVRNPLQSELLINNTAKVSDYNAINEVEIKFNQGKWRESLSKNEVLSHIFYNTLFPVGTDERKVFEKYVEWWFNTYRIDGMDVYINPKIKSEWRLVHLENYGNNSHINGYNYFNGYARFVLRP